MSHPDLLALHAALAAVEDDAQALTRGLTDAQGNWQERPGESWSIAQCLDHLTRINTLYMRHFMPVVESAATRADARPFDGLHPSVLGRMFLKVLEPPPRQRVKAPKVSIPASTLAIDDAREQYLRSHDGYRRMLELMAGFSVRGLRAQNPFVPVMPMRLSTVACVIPAHDRRHLWQARQVLQAPGFPR